MDAFEMHCHPLKRSKRCISRIVIQSNGRWLDLEDEERFILASETRKRNLKDLVEMWHFSSHPVANRLLGKSCEAVRVLCSCHNDRVAFCQGVSVQKCAHYQGLNEL